MTHTVDVGSLKKGSYFTVGTDNIYRSTGPVFDGSDNVLAVIVCMHTLDATKHLPLKGDTQVVLLSEEDHATHSQHPDWVAREEQRKKEDKISRCIIGGFLIMIFMSALIFLLHELPSIVIVAVCVLIGAGLLAIGNVLLHRVRTKRKR